MGFWLLVPGVGMGGSGAAEAESGPLCACAVQAFVPGAISGQSYTPGAKAVDSYVTTIVSQGNCC